jgi:hypothetical protein
MNIEYEFSTFKIFGTQEELISLLNYLIFIGLEKQFQRKDLKIFEYFEEYPQGYVWGFCGARATESYENELFEAIKIYLEKIQ